MGRETKTFYMQSKLPLNIFNEQNSKGWVFFPGCIAMPIPLAVVLPEPHV